MIVASVLLFGLATAHFVVDCVAIFQAFQVLDYTARLKTIANSTRRINLAKVAIFDVSMVVGDAVIVRCLYRFEVVIRLFVDLPGIYRVGKKLLGDHTFHYIVHSQCK